jgi:signal peptidase II
VVDFIDLPRLFVFNLADASITCAAVLIALLAVRGVGLDGEPSEHTVREG